MAKIGNQELTQGWYITGGIAVAIAFGNTKAAPILLGILTVALIYQVTNLIEGIPPGGSPINPGPPNKGTAAPKVTPIATGGGGSVNATFV